MAQNLPSAEYRALVSCTYKLVIGIAIDPQVVAMKLYARNLIARIPPDSGQKEETANELVRQVTNQVMNFPLKFEVFLAVLREVPALKDLATLLTEELQKITTEDSEATQIRNMSPLHTPLPSAVSTLPLSDMHISDSDHASSLPDRFPYLNSDTMSQEERERSKAKLESESDKMKDRFAILVDKVKCCLEKHNETSSNLIIFIRQSRHTKLTALIKKCKSISDLFLKLAVIWTFFDYELLRLLIERYCRELMPELAEYEYNLKQFCSRRLCQLPADIFAKRGDIHNLYVKIDRNFVTSTLVDVKKLEYRLSELLDEEIYFLKAEDGCLELVFNCLCDISTFTPEQTRKLKELGVMRIYDANKNYFNNPNTVLDQQRFDDIILPWDHKKKSKKGSDLSTSKRKFLHSSQDKADSLDEDENED